MKVEVKWMMSFVSDLFMFVCLDFNKVEKVMMFFDIIDVV